MNQNVKIADIISKLNEIDELLKSFNNDKCSTIDKDLILEKIRKMYENLLITKAENKPSDTVTKTKSYTPVEKPVKKEVVAEPVKPADKIQDTVIDFTEKPKEKTEPVVEEKAPADDYPTLFEVETIAPQTSTKETEPAPVISQKNDTVKQNATSKTISDQYQQNITKTVSDVMSKKQNEKDLSSKLQLKPIKNLKSAISINDRIMFTKELFDNDADFYNEIIEKLNGMNNLDEALEHLKMEIDLTEESEAVQKFTELVQRRFL